MLYSIIDPDTTTVFDNVQIVGCEKKNDIWHFYIQSYPCISFNREDRTPKRAYTSMELIEHVTKSLIKDGYFFSGRCSIDHDYIDSGLWFASWKEEKHKEFLNNK